MESVNPELWSRVKPLFHAALALPSAQRAAFLDEACAGEPPELRQEVERLLAAHSEAGMFIDRSPAPPERARESLTGREVGRYRIGRLIGIGGMGEVYFARDQELGRDVAFKVALTKDSDAQLRLRREAQHASRLNHPHICTIHEVGSINEQQFIVMELVEGPTLADRIVKGPLAHEEALTVARQLTEALDVAHAQGIVHRDLKPANIKMRSDGSIKVLDFGLAKSVSTVAETVTTPLTQAGLVLGTAAYMSPEQLRGAPLDKRTDIWAFGCVVYEMVTGVRAFAGENVSDTVAAVMTASPDWTRVAAPWQPLLRRCLERDPARRLRDIGDAMALAGSPRDPAVVPVVRSRALLRLLAAVLAVSTALLAGVLYMRPETPLAQLVRFNILPPDGQSFSPFAFAPSPDGRSVAFLTSARGREWPSLWVYSLESGVSRELAGVGLSERTKPFWSPDSRFLGVYSGGVLRTVEVATGTAQAVCEIQGGLAAVGTWNGDRTIVFGVEKVGGNDGLLRVSAAGGVPVLVTRADRSRGESGHVNPFFLPDGRHFLYQRIGAEGPTDLFVGQLGVQPESQPADRVLVVPAMVSYAPSPDARIGFVVFQRQGKLVAQAFDNVRLVAVGQPSAVPGQPASEIASREVALAPNVLTYRRLPQTPGVPVWVDRHGREEPALGGDTLEGPDFPRLSPDGRRLALIVNQNLWVYDLTGRPPVKLTFEGSAFAPLWTLDGRRLVYEAVGRPMQSIAADGSDSVPRPVSPAGHFHPHAFAPDGRLIAVELVGPVSDIVAIPAVGGAATPVIKGSGKVGESGAALSPDARWLAYVSTETGRHEVWVQSFPTPTVPVRVSPNSGTEPVWARNGRELFYLEGSKLMAVAVRTDNVFQAQTPVILFDHPYFRSGQPPSYDVAPDSRFLMIKASAQPDPPIATLLNWSGTLLAAIH